VPQKPRHDRQWNKRFYPPVAGLCFCSPVACRAPLRPHKASPERLFKCSSLRVCWGDSALRIPADAGAAVACAQPAAATCTGPGIAASAGGRSRGAGRSAQWWPAAGAAAARCELTVLLPTLCKTTEPEALSGPDGTRFQPELRTHTATTGIRQRSLSVAAAQGGLAQAAAARQAARRVRAARRERPGRLLRRPAAHRQASGPERPGRARSWGRERAQRPSAAPWARAAQLRGLRTGALARQRRGPA
jgi:hypothetical protein